MAEVTESNRQESFLSNKRVVQATVAAAATADEWTTGLGQIESFSLVPETDAGDVYATYSGGVLTIGYDGGGAVTFTATATGS